MIQVNGVVKFYVFAVPFMTKHGNADFETPFLFCVDFFLFYICLTSHITMEIVHTCAHPSLLGHRRLQGGLGKIKAVQDLR